MTPSVTDGESFHPATLPQLCSIFTSRGLVRVLQFAVLKIGRQDFYDSGAAFVHRYDPNRYALLLSFNTNEYKS